MDNPLARAIAMELLVLDAIKFGAFELKLHATNSNAPKSPIFLNLRTPENPKPGPLTPEVVQRIASAMLCIILQQRIDFGFIAGIPNAGTPFSFQLYKMLQHLGHNVGYIHLGKSGTGTNRKIDSITEVDLSTYEGSRRRVIWIDDLITHADSKAEAITVLRNNDYVVTDGIVLVDREQGGIQQLVQTHGCRTYAAMKLSDMLALYVICRRLSQEKSDEVMMYIAQNQFTP